MGATFTIAEHILEILDVSFASVSVGSEVVIGGIPVVLWVGSLSDIAPGNSQRNCTMQTTGVFPKVLLTALLAVGVVSVHVTAGTPPDGAHVEAGDITISSQPGDGVDTLVTQDSRIGMIDWKDFHVGEADNIHFAQPDASSITLVRMSGGDVSSILGRLSATGQIFLINPSGVLFGSRADIEVSGLLVSTASITDEGFSFARTRFEQGVRSDAEVVNHGSIRVVEGGLVALIAPRIEHSGRIEAPTGRVVLRSTPADSAYFLNFLVGPFLEFDLTSGGGLASAAAAVRATVSVSGEIAARGMNASERGGTVAINGERVGIFRGAVIDVSGMSGGGEAIVGTDHLDHAIGPAAKSTYVSPDARIVSDALGSGDGGRIVVWSDESTRAYGTATTKGGTEGGDGGFVETSSKTWLDVHGARIDVSAPRGNTGEWLLDPYNIDIVGISPSVNGAWSGTDPLIWTASGNNARLYVSDIFTNLAVANVSIVTGISGTQTGDIDLRDVVNYPGLNIRTFNLIAANDIGINAGIVGSNLDVILSASGTANVNDNGLTPRSLLIQGSSIRVDASSIVTLLSQTYGAPVVLGVDTTLTTTGIGGNLNFADTVDGGFGLTINVQGNVIFDGAVGGTTPPSYLNIQSGGMTNINTGSIATIGTQTYNSPLILGSNTVLTSAVGNVLFSTTIDGGFGLSIDAQGDVTLDGAAGGTAPLSNLDVQSGGTTNIDTGSITTTGTQTYNGAVALGANVVMTGSNLTFSGSIAMASNDLTLNVSGSGTTVNGAINGSGALTKQGNGTASLNGANTYTGATSVNAGRLLINGSLVAGSAVTVAGGGTLGGTGTVNGTVAVLSGGTLAPGLSPGILATGDLTLNSGSVLTIELAGNGPAGDPNGHDQVNVTGSVSLGNATLTIDTTGLTAGELARGQVFVIISNDGTDPVTGTFNGLAEGATVVANAAGSGLDITITYAGGADNNDVVLQISNAVTLSLSANQGSEVAETVITVTATAEAAVIGDQTVMIAASGTGITAGDGTFSDTTITILDGETSGSVTYTITNDLLVEGTETATLTLSSPSSGLTLGDPTSQDLVIIDSLALGEIPTLNELGIILLILGLAIAAIRSIHGCHPSL